MTGRDDRRHALWLGIALALATGLVFSGALELGSVEYDDPDYVTRNEHVSAGLSWQGLRWAATSSFAANWFPVTWASHMLDYELYGDDLSGFHTTNVLLHVVNTLLLFALLVRTTGRAGRSAMVAALFAVHPLHVESVAWLSERKGLLSSLFAFAALHAYVGHARAPSRARMLAVAVCFALGLASKPMVLTLPFVLLLLDVWPLERLDRERLLRAGAPLTARVRESGLVMLVREKWPLFLLTAASIGITLAVQRVAVVDLEQLPAARRAATVGVAYWKYLAMTLWPFGLSPVHLHPGPDISLLRGGLGLVGLLAVTVAALASLRQRPVLTVGWLWFVGMLVPVTGIVQVGSAIVAERYTYLPLIGLFVAAVWTLADRIGDSRRARAASLVLAVVLLVGCAAVSRARIQDWRDTVSLFARAVEFDPSNHLAHAVLGLGYARARQDDRAIEHYLRSAQLRPENHTLLLRIGRRLARKGDFPRAQRALELELELAPRFVAGRNELALLWLEQGRLEEARSEFEKVLEINPNYAIAHENLGQLALRGRPDLRAAQAHFARAVELSPGRVSARLALARLLLRAGEREAALAQLEAAGRLAPDDPAVREARRALPAGRVQ